MLRPRFGLLLVGVFLAAGCFGGLRRAPAPPEITTLRSRRFNIFYGGDELDLQTRQFCTDPAGLPGDARRRSQPRSSVGRRRGRPARSRRRTPARSPRRSAGTTASARRSSRASRSSTRPAPTGSTSSSSRRPGAWWRWRTSTCPRTPTGLTRRAAVPRGTRCCSSRTTSACRPSRPSSRASGARGDGHPRLPHRRLQLALPPRLDAGGRRRARRCPYPVVWPVSKALADAGFMDSYRVVYPDPGRPPGFTWTPGGPESARPRCSTASTGSSRWGRRRQPEQRGRGGRERERRHRLDRWPSDHRGVVSAFDVTPSPTPTSSRPRRGV